MFICTKNKLNFAESYENRSDFIFRNSGFINYFQKEMSNFTLCNNGRPTCCCVTNFALVLSYFRLLFKLRSIRIRHCIVKSDAIKLAVDVIV